MRTQHLQAAAPAPTFVDNKSTVSLRSPVWTNAVVLIDKPLGWTSFDVCAKLKSVLRVKKVGMHLGSLALQPCTAFSLTYGRNNQVGHAGTLDPNATGLLIVLTGRATKLADSYQGLQKAYSGQHIVESAIHKVCRHAWLGNTAAMQAACGLERQLLPRMLIRLSQSSSHGSTSQVSTGPHAVQLWATSYQAGSPACCCAHMCCGRSTACSTLLLHVGHLASQALP